MGVEAQAPERTMTPVGGASLATIESLRARLLAERAASKDAREHAHKIALKVSELQKRLDAEIEQRKKAEVAMKEVLDTLRAKGVAMEEVGTAVISRSVSSEIEEAIQLMSSKDGESEHSSGEESSQRDSIFTQQDNIVEVPRLEDLGGQSEAGTQDEDSLSSKTKVMVEHTSKRHALELGKVLVMESEHSLRSAKSDTLTEVAEKDELIEHEQDEFNHVLDKDSHVLQGEKDELIEHKQDEFNHVLDKDSHVLQCERDITRPSETLDESSQDHVMEQGMSSNGLRPNVHSGCASLSEYLEQVAGLYQAAETNFENTVDLPGEQSFIFNKSLPLPPNCGIEKSKGLPLEGTATHVISSPSAGLGDGCIYGDGRVVPVEVKPLRGLPTRDMAPPVRESTLGIGPIHMHPVGLTRGVYSYKRQYMDSDPLQHMHYMPLTEASAPFSRGPMSPADTAEFARYPPQVPVNDAILNLVDDKMGKLGNILMALNLAKQHINDEDCTAAHMELSCEATASAGPFMGTAYPGLYEGVPHQPPNHPWRFEPQSQVPTVHFPISPRSDHEPSPFEENEGVGRNNSLTSAYYMPGYDPYLQPKGELHLGNGITLYMD